MPRRFYAAAVAAALLAGVACKNTTAIAANLPVTTDTLVAYALSGTPASLPSGLAIAYRSAVRVSTSSPFDLAFDLDSAARVVVSPARAIVSPLLGNIPLVAIQTSAGTFESIVSAPTGYYRPDTAIVVSPHQAFVVLSTRPTGSQTCLYSPVPRIYSKVVIDSVEPRTARAIYLRVTTDPNCGYRSFEPGLPTN